MAPMWQGLAGAPGIAVGPAVLVEGPEAVHGEETCTLPELEKEALARAVEAVRGELTLLQRRTEQELGREQAAIFSAHLLMLDDPALTGEVNRLIEEHGLTAASALTTVVDGLSASVAASPDEYIRERAVDVRDVGDRLLTHLGRTGTEEILLREPAVIAGEDLKPSLVARLPREKLLALVSGAGGATGHVAILARSLGIPAVLGLGDVLHQVSPGDVLAVDGEHGRVVLDPQADELARWRELQAEQEERGARLEALQHLPAQTLDGHRVHLAVNISSPADIKALAPGNDGVGLFRTEFIYMDKKELPGEEEQFQIYREVVSSLAPRPVIIRTMDVGGDKDAPCLGRLAGENPFLGLRGLRFSLARPQILRTQLRAILRSSSYGKVKIMLPMVSTVEEVRAAKAHLAEVRAELEGAQVVLAASVEVGIMIEVPAAAMAADLLAPEVDFFSIGSNDLIQYTMAADRHNETVAYLYQPLHPAVLRQIERTINTAHAAGIEVGLCGEMAADPVAVPILLGLGLDEFSVAAPALAGVKERIRSLAFRDAREMAQTALTLPDAASISRYIDSHVASQ